jgi:hypothetical protein
VRTAALYTLHGLYYHQMTRPKFKVLEELYFIKKNCFQFYFISDTSDSITVATNFKLCLFIREKV